MAQTVSSGAVMNYLGAAPGRTTTSERGSARADLESALDTESDLHAELTQIIPVRVGGI